MQMCESLNIANLVGFLKGFFDILRKFFIFLFGSIIQIENSFFNELILRFMMNKPKFK